MESQFQRSLSLYLSIDGARCLRTYIMQFMHLLIKWINEIWKKKNCTIASTWENDIYHKGNQQRHRWAHAKAQLCHRLCCSQAYSREQEIWSTTNRKKPWGPFFACQLKYEIWINLYDKSSYNTLTTKILTNISKRSGDCIAQNCFMWLFTFELAIDFEFYTFWPFGTT